MDKKEAKEILATHLQRYRRCPYQELLYLLNTQDTSEITAPSGNWYQIEVEAMWVDKVKGHLRVFGCIDDGGL